MSSGKSMKAGDKQAVCRKLITALKKRYKSTPPKFDQPVLETMLFATCLENSPFAKAQAAYDQLLQSFHDLNEIRVSSLKELEVPLATLTEPVNRALGIRTILHYSFEKNYDFELEVIRRKTLELATRQLDKITNISPFIRTHTLQVCLGAHVVPVDDVMCDASVFLGFADSTDEPAEIAESLKSAMKKAEVPLFCHLLRQFATDAELLPVLAHAREDAPDEGYDLTTAQERMAELIASPKRKPRRKKTVSSEEPAGKGKRQKSAARKTSGAADESKSVKKTATPAKKKSPPSRKA